MTSSAPNWCSSDANSAPLFLGIARSSPVTSADFTSASVAAPTMNRTSSAPRSSGMACPPSAVCVTCPHGERRGSAEFLQPLHGLAEVLFLHGLEVEGVRGLEGALQRLLQPGRGGRGVGQVAHDLGQFLDRAHPHLVPIEEGRRYRGKRLLGRVVARVLQATSKQQLL